MFRFWYRFIPDNASLIVRGASDLAYQRIRPQLSDYMGKSLKISAPNIYGSCS